MNEIQTTNDVREVKRDLQNFTKLLNRKPVDKTIKVNQFANNSKYIPIGTVENQLDQMFFGLWETINFKYQVVANELIGDIELVITHPITGLKYKRSGAGGMAIRFKKDSTSYGVENKVTNALTADLPHLKSECIKNAAKSFGEFFGRNLNRDHFGDYQPLIPDEDKIKLDEIEALYKEKIDRIAEDDKIAIDRIIQNKEKTSYPKLLKLLKEL